LTRRGLGRGLGALIPTEANFEDNVQEIEINKIKTNKNQPRKNFNEERLDELYHSIKAHGVLQPVILRKLNDGYELVAGERRLRAALKANLRKIPAIVKKLTDSEAMEIALIENLQREDLNPLEEAAAYKRLMVEFKMTQDELSKRVGKSRSQIANTVRLLNLDEPILKMISDNKLTAGHGRALLSVEGTKDRLLLAQKIIDGNLSVRQVEELSKNESMSKKKKKNAPKEINPVFIELTDKLQRSLGTKVKIKGTEKRGKIEIEFYSTDELERLLEMLID
jgi:ParB family chromosome partitioning protein